MNETELMGARNPAERLVAGFGSRTAVRDAFGLRSNEAVRLWLKNGIPADRALEVEEVTRAWELPISAAEVLQFQKHQRQAA